MADPIMEIADSARSQVERDLAKHVTDKVTRAINDAWELVDSNGERTRIAVMAAVAAMGSAAAAMHEARMALPGICPSERDMFFAILKILGDNCPPLKDFRRG